MGGRQYALPKWRFYDLLMMLGTAEDIAKMLGDRGYPTPPAFTVQGWRNRDMLPAQWVPVFIKIALEGGFIKDIDDLKVPMPKEKEAVTTCLVAIDPGAVSGALAFFFSNGSVLVTDIPVVDKQVDGAGLAAILRYDDLPKAAVVERVASMPKQGVASTFKFGMGTGIIHGVLLSLGIPTHLVTPGQWKKHYSLGSDKEAARALAIRLYPGVAGLSRKKDQGRAEALLLGRYWIGKNR